MANFHTNMLAIVADEENMMKVMRLFWSNYENAAEETGFNARPLDQPTLRQLWIGVRSYLDQWYEYAFRKDYLGSEGRQTVGEATTDSGTTVGISVAPVGRPYSETAIVDLGLWNGDFAFHMEYSTAWVSNFDHDISDFIERLPEGEYGIAFLDADEGDWYETISIQYCLWKGRGKVEREGVFEIKAQEARGRYEELIAGGIGELDLAARSLAAGLERWMASLDFAPYRDGEGEDGDNDASIYDLADLNWGVADGAPLSEVWRFLLRELSGSPFPMLAGISGSAYQGREANIEKLIVGDELILRSDWESKYFSPVGIEVFTLDGESIGNLDGYGSYSGIFLDDGTRTALALILPSVRAVVQEVTPLFMRRKNAKYSHVLVRIDFCILDWESMKREVGQMLSEPPAERARESFRENGDRP